MSTREPKESFDYLLADIADYPVIRSKEEELMLGRRAREGDDVARERLITANLRFCIAQAKKHQNRGLTMAELVSAAYEGLIKAVDNYDPSHGVKVITYALDWITQEITREIQSNAKTVRHSGSQQDKNAKVRRLVSEAEQRGESLSVEDIMRITGYRKPRVLEALQPDPSVVSLDKPMGDDPDASPLMDVLGDDEEQALLEEIQERNEVVHEFLNALDPRRRRIILLHYGFFDSEEWVYDDLVNVVGVCRERVRQLKIEAEEILRESGLADALKSGVVPDDLSLG